MPEGRKVNITYKFDQKALDDLIKSLKKAGKIINNPDMNKFRARKFRRFVRSSVHRGELGLKRISEATKIIQGRDHPAEFNTGQLLNQMRIRAIKNSTGAEMGFFSDSREVPGKKITYTKAAILQHTGYRIPLTGKKGQRVKNWLAWKLKDSGERGLPSSDPKGSKKWIVVPPRPFLWRSYFRYVTSGEDIAAVDKFVRTLENSPGAGGK